MQPGAFPSLRQRSPCGRLSQFAHPRALSRLQGHVVFLELGRDSRVTTGNSGFPPRGLECWAAHRRKEKGRGACRRLRARGCANCESLPQGDLCLREGKCPRLHSQAVSPRGNPACRGTFGGRRKAVRDRLALQGGTRPWASGRCAQAHSRHTPLPLTPAFHLLPLLSRFSRVRLCATP